MTFAIGLYVGLTAGAGIGFITAAMLIGGKTADRFAAPKKGRTP